MATFVRQKPAGWFLIVGVLLLLWGLVGCASFYMHVKYGADMDPAATDWDRAYFAALPAWLNVDFAIATVAGLLGSIALLARSRLARPLYIVSLLAVIVQFGYIFFATDIIAHKGAAMVVPFPLFIAAVGVFEIWFATHAQRRGWIS